MTSSGALNSACAAICEFRYEAILSKYFDRLKRLQSRGVAAVADASAKPSEGRAAGRGRTRLETSTGSSQSALPFCIITRFADPDIRRLYFPIIDLLVNLVRNRHFSPSLALSSLSRPSRRLRRRRHRSWPRQVQQRQVQQRPAWPSGCRAGPARAQWPRTSS